MTPLLVTTVSESAHPQREAGKNWELISWSTTIIGPTGTERIHRFPWISCWPVPTAPAHGQARVLECARAGDTSGARLRARPGRRAKLWGLPGQTPLPTRWLQFSRLPVWGAFNRELHCRAARLHRSKGACKSEMCREIGVQAFPKVCTESACQVAGALRAQDQQT